MGKILASIKDNIIGALYLDETKLKHCTLDDVKIEILVSIKNNVIGTLDVEEKFKNCTFDDIKIEIQNEEE